MMLDGLTWISWIYLHAGFIVDAVDSWHCETKIATKARAKGPGTKKLGILAGGDGRSNNLPGGTVGCLLTNVKTWWWTRSGSAANMTKHGLARGFGGFISWPSRTFEAWRSWNFVTQSGKSWTRAPCWTGAPWWTIILRPNYVGF